MDAGQPCQLHRRVWGIVEMIDKEKLKVFIKILLMQALSDKRLLYMYLHT
jgi:hypothetical protein